MTEPIVALQGVQKSFQRREVIREATFDVLAREALALRGPNGSGKSVLLRLMAGLLLPDAGSVRISPEYLSPRRTFPQNFGAIIDRPGFIPTASGRTNLIRLAAIRGLIGVGEVEEAMRLVGLEPDLVTPVGRYSLGMRQKLALAQAFMEGQQVLLLDEPFNALDRASVDRTHELLARFHAEGRTIVFTSHQDSDIALLATRELVIDDGRVLAG